MNDIKHRLTVGETPIVLPETIDDRPFQGRIPFRRLGMSGLRRLCGAVIFMVHYIVILFLNFRNPSRVIRVIVIVIQTLSELRYTLVSIDIFAPSRYPGIPRRVK